MGASNPISQAAAVMDETYALNAQESAARANAGPVAPAQPAQPAWTQDLASAYNSKDWSAVENIIKTNGLTADQIAQTYNITNPSTLANIQDIVTNGAGTSLDTVNVTGTNGSTTTTPGVTGPAVPSTNLNTVTVTAPGGTGVTAPATPAVTGPVIPTVTVTGKTGTDLVGPPTPPVTPVIPTVTVIGSKDPGLVVPKVTPPVVVPPVVVPPVVPSIPVTPPVVVTTSKTGGGTSTTTKPTTPTSSGGLSMPTTQGALVNPGLNPGYIQATPAYQTTNPVQSKFYWGQHPYAIGPADIGAYNYTPQAPATPWGAQQALTGPVTPAATRTPSTQHPIQTQLHDAWNTGNYDTVNDIVKNNDISTLQTNALYGPSVTQDALAHGVQLSQPTPYTPMTHQMFSDAANALAATQAVSSTTNG